MLRSLVAPTRGAGGFCRHIFDFSTFGRRPYEAFSACSALFNFRIGKPEFENLTGHGLYCLSALRELGKTAEQPPTVVDERSRAKAYGLSAISAPFRFRNFGATCFSPLNFCTSLIRRHILSLQLSTFRLNFKYSEDIPRKTSTRRNYAR